MADYISREPMIREMQQLYEGVPYNFPNSTYTEWEILRGKYAAFIDYLKQQPAADVQPIRHGRWISKGSDLWLCSNCENNLIYSTSDRDRTEKQRYCSRCGSRMDGEQNE